MPCPRTHVTLLERPPKSRFCDDNRKFKQNTNPHSVGRVQICVLSNGEICIVDLYAYKG